MIEERNCEEVRIQAAIAMLPKCYEVTVDTLKTGSSIQPHHIIPECAAVNAVICADELVKQLQQGKATDYYKEGYRDALAKVQNALAGESNNMDRLHAVYVLLDEQNEGGKP